MWVNGCVQSAVPHAAARPWRLCRGHRARLVIGESVLRHARTAAKPTLVVVARRRQHAVPQRAWQHARCAGIPRRCWTFSALLRARLRALGRPFGVSRVLCPKRTVLRWETIRHVLRFEGTRSLLSGRVGGDRAAAVTSRWSSGRTPHQPDISGCGSEVMAYTLPLTSRRHRWETAGGVGVSNR
jgi:hypothetical protein